MSEKYLGQRTKEREPQERKKGWKYVIEMRTYTITFAASFFSETRNRWNFFMQSSMLAEKKYPVLCCKKKGKWIAIRKFPVSHTHKNLSSLSNLGTIKEFLFRLVVYFRKEFNGKSNMNVNEASDLTRTKKEKNWTDIK